MEPTRAVQTAYQWMSTATQRFRRSDPVYESVNPETGKMKWELVEITCPWPWIDDDGETLEKAYRKNLNKDDVLRQELKKEYPHQEVEQGTIMVGATAVFHMRSQIEFAKATRLQKKDLARWQRNAVDMDLHSSYQTFHESIEKAKHNQKFSPTAEIIAALAEHEIDLVSDGDEDQVGVDLA
jgi:hypothetical protein